METYGQVVQRLRDAHGWSQQELADRSGVPKRTIQDVEAGKHGNPQRKTRVALGEALDIPAPDGVPRADDETLADLFAEFDRDIQTMLLTVGAYLETLSESARLAWFRSTVLRSMTARG